MAELKEMPAVLLLEDGTVFWGKSAGKTGTTTGEICFNTGMTGYQEIFTDPSYYGQILVATNAHIGNYGTKSTEAESEKVKIAGLEVKNFTSSYNRNLADHSIQEYLENESLVAISDVDTRAIVRHIRSKGAMNAIISSETLEIEPLRELLTHTPSMAGLELASLVSTTAAYDLGKVDSQFKVAVLDFGVKKSILQCLTDRGCQLRIFPARASIAALNDWKPDGYFLSNGPGDPAAMDYAVETVKSILSQDKPVFGICLGHQLLARAVDVPTFKMHHGHRGINHPVQNLRTGRCEITSQNHGFGVDYQALLNKSESIEISHMNLNDDTVEGIRLKNLRAFSVQYHPEASPGPHDSRYLFDEFVEMLRTGKN
jgi:carbamoyl-phosphate synthase small subunit